jgi:hypothetical protein
MTIILIRNTKRIIIKLEAEASQRKNEEDRPVVQAGMTLNRFHTVKVSKSKHLLRSPRQGLVPRPTAD